jgi:hypothetical protein
LRIRPYYLILAAILLGPLPGCVTPNQAPGPYTVPSAQTQTACRLGTPLSGPRAGDSSSISFSHALDVRVKWYIFERFDGAALPLLGSQARLIAARLGGLAVLPSGRLTSGARVQWGDEKELTRLLATASPARKTELMQARAALPSGVTDCFRIVDTAGPVDRTLDRPELRYIEVDIASASPKSLRIAVCVQDSPDAAAGDTGPYQFETALLDHEFATPTSQSLLLIIPFKFSGPPNQSAAVLITFSLPCDDPAFKEAIAACKHDLDRGESDIGSGPAWTLGLEQALSALDAPRERRAAMVYLAGQTQAPLCADVAAVCDDAMLAEIAYHIHAAAADALKSDSVDDFSWLLDRSAISAMQGPLFKAQLSPELFEILTLYMGETGRHAAAVDEVMRGVTSRRELERRLISENYIYLQDSSPAYRARAYQWLKARNLAPANFDPLGTPRQRREALDQALSSSSIATPGGGQ